MKQSLGSTMPLTKERAERGEIPLFRYSAPGTSDLPGWVSNTIPIETVAGYIDFNYYMKMTCQ